MMKVTVRYKEGEYLLIRYEASLSSGKFVLKMNEEGNYSRPAQPMRIVVMIDGQTEVHHTVSQYLNEISFDIKQ